MTLSFSPIAVVLALLATAGRPAHAVAAEATCGGIVMGHVSKRTFDKGMRRATLNNFLIDGALFANGKNLCKPVTIQCDKSAGTCDMMTVEFWFGGPHPEYLNTTLYDPMKINQWTEGGINAAGQIGLCQWGQLVVNFDAKAVRLVTTIHSGPGCEGSPEIEILDVQSDPLAVP